MLDESNGKYSAIVGGVMGFVVGIILVSLGCALYGLPWDVMLFHCLIRCVVGSCVGILAEHAFG